MLSTFSYAYWPFGYIFYIHKINSKWTLDLNKKGKAKFTEENLGEYEYISC